jgi:hypothetical protein
MKKRKHKRGGCLVERRQSYKDIKSQYRVCTVYSMTERLTAEVTIKIICKRDVWHKRNS